MDKDILAPFAAMMYKDERVYLIKETVNTLLASSLATEKNGLFKLSKENEARMKEAISKSNRFNEEEKTAFLELMDIALKNPNNCRSLSITWRPNGTAMNAISAYKAMIESVPPENPEDFEPIDLNF